MTLYSTPVSLGHFQTLVSEAWNATTSSNTCQTCGLSSERLIECLLRLHSQISRSGYPTDLGLAASVILHILDNTSRTPSVASSPDITIGLKTPNMTSGMPHSASCPSILESTPVSGGSLNLSSGAGVSAPWTSSGTDTAR